MKIYRQSFVIPAQAGIHSALQSFMDPRLRGGDGKL